PEASQVECKTAQAETAVTLARGQRLDVPIDVRACVQLVLNFTPAEARVTFEPLDGGRRVETLADAKPLPAITTGRYVISASAPRCTPYTADTVDVRRTAENKPFTRRVSMQCN
ncbi:MAG: hypothetical protein ABIW79_01500, partial [Gemmatimonas sp.]